jgi:hypothetical protein
VVSGGFFATGGGIDMESYDATLVDGCTISGNIATGQIGGGGIRNGNTHGIVTLSRCSIVGNSGGSVLNDSQGTPDAAGMVIINSTISGSAAIRGTGLENSGTLVVVNAIIRDNFIGVINDGFGTMSISNSIISGQSTSVGIDNEGSTLTVTNCTFSDNGGGILNQLHGILTISNSTFSNNSGWGITNEGTRAAVSNCTISGNGLGIENSSALTLKNTLVAGNGSDARGRFNSLGHNLLGMGEGASGFTDTDLVGTASDPINPLLDLLRDNGGPTPTMALLPGSAAIEAGALTDSEWDQRGPGYPRQVNGATDIGAYEVEDGQGTGSSARALRNPKATIVVLRTAPSQPLMPTPAPGDATSPSGPDPFVVAMDRFFASWSQETEVLLSRLRHTVPGEADLWAMVFSFEGSSARLGVAHRPTRQCRTTQNHLGMRCHSAAGSLSVTLGGGPWRSAST